MILEKIWFSFRKQIPSVRISLTSNCRDPRESGYGCPWNSISHFATSYWECNEFIVAALRLQRAHRTALLSCDRVRASLKICWPHENVSSVAARKPECGISAQHVAIKFRRVRQSVDVHALMLHIFTDLRSTGALVYCCAFFLCVERQARKSRREMWRDNYEYYELPELGGVAVLFVVTTRPGWLAGRLRAVLLDARLGGGACALP